MKARLENHIAQRENQLTAAKFLNDTNWRLLLWGYVMGSKKGAGVETEKAIRNFMEGKEIPYEESDIKTLLVMWQDFTQTELYKSYQ